MQSRIEIKIGIIGEKSAGKSTFLQMLMPSITIEKSDRSDRSDMYITGYFEAEPKLSKGYAEVNEFVQKQKDFLNNILPNKNVDEMIDDENINNADAVIREIRLNGTPIKAVKVDRANNSDGFSMRLLEKSLIGNILLTFYDFGNSYGLFEKELRQMNLIYYIVDGIASYGKSDLIKYLYDIVSLNATDGKHTIVQPVINKVSNDFANTGHIDAIKKIIKDNTNGDHAVLFNDPITLDSLKAVYAIRSLTDHAYDQAVRESNYNNFRKHFIFTMDRYYKQFLLENLHERFNNEIEDLGYINENTTHVISYADKISKITGMDISDTMRDVIIRKVDAIQSRLSDLTAETVNATIDTYLNLCHRHEMFRQCIAIIEDMKKKYSRYYIEAKVHVYTKNDIISPVLLNIRAVAKIYHEVHSESVDIAKVLLRAYTEKFSDSIKNYIISKTMIDDIYNVLFQLDLNEFIEFINLVHRNIGADYVKFCAEFVCMRVLFAVTFVFDSKVMSKDILNYLLAIRSYVKSKPDLQLSHHIEYFIESALANKNVSMLKYKLFDTNYLLTKTESHIAIDTICYEKLLDHIYPRIIEKTDNSSKLIKIDSEMEIDPADIHFDMEDDVPDIQFDTNENESDSEEFVIPVVQHNPSKPKKSSGSKTKKTTNTQKKKKHRKH